MTQMVVLPRGIGCGGCGCSDAENGTTKQNHISLVALLVTALRKSMAACRVDDQGGKSSKSAAFHRFHGFLGLLVEFEVEIPCRVPSASVSVFGVSAKSMQCSYDSRGNSVPTILLLMQERLYAQEGLKLYYMHQKKKMACFYSTTQ